MATKTKKGSKKGSNFLSGALVGATLGIAASMFATSKKGQEMEQELKDKIKMTDFYKNIAPKIKKAKSIGEKEYKSFIAKSLIDYNKNGKLSKEDLERMTKEAQASWKHIKKHL
jgi:gas vesicle protein